MIILADSRSKARPLPAANTLQPARGLPGSPSTMSAHASSRSERREGVHELKFPVPPAAIEPTLHWMRTQLHADPHGGGNDGDAYLVQSIYLDTPEFDVYHRRGSFGRAKFRIRRYGDAPFVFLERKLKRGGIVRKRRQAVGPAEVSHLHRRTNGSTWSGDWFRHRLELRRLAPVVEMNYHRIARLGSDSQGPFRVTLDRRLVATPAGAFDVPRRLEGTDLFEGRAMLEIKYDLELPAAAREFLGKTGLAVAGFSKYRTGVRAVGLVVPDAAQDPTDDESEPLRV